MSRLGSIRVLLAVGYALVADPGVAASMVLHAPATRLSSLSVSDVNIRVLDGTCKVAIQSSPEQIMAARRAMEEHMSEPNWPGIRFCPIPSSDDLVHGMKRRPYWFSYGTKGKEGSGLLLVLASPIFVPKIDESEACDIFERVKREVQAPITGVDKP